MGSGGRKSSPHHVWRRADNAKEHELEDGFEVEDGL